jgi:DNA-binding XRE family transcriptional regulator
MIVVFNASPLLHMTAKPQIIERDGEPEYAVIPYAEYQEMSRLCAAMRDIENYDAALADEGEVIPHEIMRRLVAGDSPILLWRWHRGLSRTELAQQAAIDKTYLLQLESGRKTGSVAVLKRLAAVLSVDLDDLVTDA